METENQIKIPKRETKDKVLGFKASVTEIRKLKDFCKRQQISQSEVIRYAIRQIIPNF